AAEVLFSFPSVDCLRLRIRQTLCQWPSAKSPRMVIYPNYLPVDGLFLCVPWLGGSSRSISNSPNPIRSDRMATRSDSLLDRETKVRRPFLPLCNAGLFIVISPHWLFGSLPSPLLSPRSNSP